MVVDTCQVFRIEFGAFTDQHLTEVIGHTLARLVFQQGLQFVHQQFPEIGLVLLVRLFDLLQLCFFTHFGVLVFFGALEQFFVDDHSFRSAWSFQ